MLCHSIYLQVVKVHLFNLGLPMNRYTFVLPSENQNAFACAPSAQMQFVDRNFLQRYTRNFEIRRRVLRVKKMTKLKKEHTSISLSLSLSLSICRCTSIFLKGCACTSLSLLLSIYICKNGLDPDQTRMEFRKRMFRQFKNVCMR